MEANNNNNINKNNANNHQVSEETIWRETQNELFKKQFAQSLLMMYSNYLSAGGSKDSSSKIPLINSVTMLISPRPGSKDPVIHSDDQVIVAAARELEKLKSDISCNMKTEFEEAPELQLPSATLKAKFERNLQKNRPIVATLERAPLQNYDLNSARYPSIREPEFNSFTSRDYLLDDSKRKSLEDEYSCVEEDFKMPFSTGIMAFTQANNTMKEVR